MEEERKLIRNIIFDIGNVLADFAIEEFYRSRGYSGEIWERLMKATARDPDWAEFDRGVLSMEQVLERFIENDPGIEGPLRESFRSVEGMVTRREDTVPWLNSLRAKGYGLYYLSNFSEKARWDCAEALDFLPLMDGGILSYQEKLIKPDPAIYELLLARYGLKASECVFLDDMSRNVEAARKLGIEGIRFQSREQAQEELRRLGADA